MSHGEASAWTSRISDAPTGGTILLRSARSRRALRRDPERIGLIKPEIAAGIPGVEALLRHVADFRSDHDGLAGAVDGADGEHLVGVGLQDVLPRPASTALVGGLFPLPQVVEQLAG